MFLKRHGSGVPAAAVLIFHWQAVRALFTAGARVVAADLLALFNWAAF